MQESLRSTTHNNTFDSSAQKTQKHCNITGLGEQYKILLRSRKFMYYFRSVMVSHIFGTLALQIKIIPAENRPFAVQVLADNFLIKPSS
jgi:hypothetical protein